jgi:hypothetical protein
MRIATASTGYYIHNGMFGHGSPARLRIGVERASPGFRKFSERLAWKVPTMRSVEFREQIHALQTDA